MSITRACWSHLLPQDVAFIDASRRMAPLDTHTKGKNTGSGKDGIVWELSRKELNVVIERVVALDNGDEPIEAAVSAGPFDTIMCSSLNFIGSCCLSSPGCNWICQPLWSDA